MGKKRRREGEKKKKRKRKRKEGDQASQNQEVWNFGFCMDHMEF